VAILELFALEAVPVISGGEQLFRRRGDPLELVEVLDEIVDDRAPRGMGEGGGA
jgi:hypothetical protein